MGHGRSITNGVHVASERVGVQEFLEDGEREPDPLADWRGPRSEQRAGNCGRCRCAGECMARVIALQPFVLERCNAPETPERRFLASGWERWDVVRACLVAGGRPMSVSEIARATGIVRVLVYMCLRQAILVGLARLVEVRQDGERHFNLYEVVVDATDVPPVGRSS
jgi:hypothetical protein